MSAIKECKRCHLTAPHHSELDNICMQCEMEKYYPDEPTMKAGIGLLESSAYLDQSLEEMKELLDETDTMIKRAETRLSINPFSRFLSGIFR